MMPYQQAIKAFIAGNLEIFRHPLIELCINHRELPSLTIAIEARDVISFDYRKGHHWQAEDIRALLELLALIKDQAPLARIFQSAECYPPEPNENLKQAFETYYHSTRLHSLK